MPERGIWDRHLTAFALSNLRYVLYAAEAGADGNHLCDVSSAHAILASRQVGKKRGLGGHGYWIESRNLSMPPPCPIKFLLCYLGSWTC